MAIVSPITLTLTRFMVITLRRGRVSAKVFVCCHNTHTDTHTHIIDIDIHIHIQMHIPINTHTPTPARAHAHTYHLQIRIHMHIHMHMHIHTLIHSDVNECLQNNGGCHSKRECTNTEGSMSCGDCATDYVIDGLKGCKKS